MIKTLRILTLSLVFTFLIGGTQVFAQSDGYLNNKFLNVGNTSSVIDSTTNLLTDNDSNTTFNFGRAKSIYVWYEFDEPVTITHIKSLNNYGNRVRLYINDIKIINGVDGIMINESDPLNVWTELSEPLTNVYKIALFNWNSSHVGSLGEFDVKIINDYIPIDEVKNLNVKEFDSKVILNYNLPTDVNFSHVNIYQDGVKINTSNVVDNTYTVTDLTNDTIYQFKVTTVDLTGNESEGVTVQATTLAAPPPPPPPELGGQEFIEQENGDYLVTWQQPETGQVRILVDGQEYVVVPATDKQYTIPASDMKYSALGDPLVGLQTIGDNGQESEIISGGSNVELPFGSGELIETSVGLLRFVGSLILLGLSFILVPNFIKVIKQSLNNKKNAETERTEREQRVSERAYREPRESRISTREGRTSTRVPRAYRKGE